MFFQLLQLLGIALRNLNDGEIHILTDFTTCKIIEPTRLSNKCKNDPSIRWLAIEKCQRDKRKREAVNKFCDKMRHWKASGFFYKISNGKYGGWGRILNLSEHRVPGVDVHAIADVTSRGSGVMELCGPGGAFVFTKEPFRSIRFSPLDGARVLYQYAKIKIKFLSGVNGKPYKERANLFYPRYMATVVRDYNGIRKEQITEDNAHYIPFLIMTRKYIKEFASEFVITGIMGLLLLAAFIFIGRKRNRQLFKYRLIGFILGAIVLGLLVRVNFFSITLFPSAKFKGSILRIMENNSYGYLDLWFATMVSFISFGIYLLVEFTLNRHRVIAKLINWKADELRKIEENKQQ